MEIRREDSIESFIRKNRDEFEIQRPSDDHAKRFMERLNRELKHLISIVPYLVRLAIATLLLSAFSVIIWNNFVRKDRNEISLKRKITLVIHSTSRKILK